MSIRKTISFTDQHSDGSVLIARALRKEIDVQNVFRTEEFGSE